MQKYKKVTTSDIAKEAGVSQSTVSMILNKKEHKNFSEETIENVLTAAKQLGYKEKKEKLIINDHSKYIIVVCPTIGNPYYTVLCEAVQSVANKEGYNVLIYITMRNFNQESALISLMDSMKVCGVIYAYYPSRLDIIKEIERKVPLVMVGDKDENLEVDAVELNSIKSGVIMAEHLLNLGHKKIAFISTPIGKCQLARTRRFEGLQLRFNEAGIVDGIVLKTKEDGNVDTSINSYTEYSTGYELTKEIIQEHPEVTAIVGLNDMFAIGIVDALMDLNYRIPEDYSVMGCDNIMYGRSRKMSLTTVEHYITAKGTQATELLLRKTSAMGTAEEFPVGIMRVEYEPRIIPRDSTGKPKNMQKNH